MISEDREEVSVPPCQQIGVKIVAIELEDPSPDLRLSRQWKPKL
jgi:hypothetical protein